MYILGRCTYTVDVHTRSLSILGRSMWLAESCTHSVEQGGRTNWIARTGDLEKRYSKNCFAVKFSRACRSSASGHEETSKRQMAFSAYAALHRVRDCFQMVCVCVVTSARHAFEGFAKWAMASRQEPCQASKRTRTHLLEDVSTMHTAENPYVANDGRATIGNHVHALKCK